MDKEMKKPQVILGAGGFFILALVLFLLCGCTTCTTSGRMVKGTARCAVEGAKSVAYGMEKDLHDSYDFIQTLDRWMRKNLW
jgi:hypothetical protein